VKTPGPLASFCIWMLIFMTTILATSFYGLAGLLSSFMFWLVIMFVIVIILNKIE